MGTQILHVSDTHLGKTQYGSHIRREDYARAFDTVVDIAISEGVDAVVHTGDFFDSRSPNTIDISNAFSSVKRLVDNDIPFMGIVGNHERKWDNQWLDIFQNLGDVYRLGQEPVNLNNEVAVYGFDSIRDSQWDTMNFSLEKPDNDEMTVLLCMHELFTELVPPAKADRSVEDILEKIDVEPDAIPLGDYHSAVETDVNGTPMFYAGATERTSATQRDPTVRLLNVENGELSSYEWRKIEGVREDVPRPFYVVDIELNSSSTKSRVRRRVEENIPEEHMTDATVVVNLTGNSDAPLTPSGAYEVLESLSVRVPYVSDKRRPEVVEFDSEKVSDPTSIDIEQMIDNQVEDVSSEVKSIDSDVARDLTVNKSDIRDIVSEMFQINGGDKNEN